MHQENAQVHYKFFKAKTFKFTELDNRDKL